MFSFPCLLCVVLLAVLVGQHVFLTSAAYGRRFIDGYDTSRFIKICSSLRILNSLRRHSVGMPLTFEQLERLTLGVVVDRLAFRCVHRWRTARWRGGGGCPQSSGASWSALWLTGKLVGFAAGGNTASHFKSVTPANYGKRRFLCTGPVKRCVQVRSLA